MKAISNVEWGIHLTLVVVSLCWLNYPAFDLSYGVFRSGDGSLMWPSVIGTAINLVLFYAIAFHLIPVVLKKGVAPFVLWLTFLFVSVSLVESMIDAAFYRSSGLPMNDAVWLELILMVTGMHVLVVTMAFAYRFSRDWFANERLRRSISEHQLRAELDVLKSQINPHFLFNALNNLFSMALQSGDEKTAEGISKLSEMMRYVLERASEDKVSLQEEIQYISDYNYLQQLRFKEHVRVQFDYPEGPVHFQIAPMLLVPFVENAFKYGVSSKTCTTITISMTLREEAFVFEIDNQKVESRETIPSTGLGLKNVRQRLQLVYPDRHELTIAEDDHTYKARLTISP